MNKSFKTHFIELPAQLQKMFMANFKHEFEWLKTENGDFREFIDRSLTWDATNEGRKFWEQLSYTTTHAERDTLGFYKTYRQHFETLNDAQKALFIKYSRIGADEIFWQKMGSFQALINKITWDETPQGRKYWELVKDGINDTYTSAIELAYTVAVKTINGTTIPRYEAIELSISYYGAKRYIDPNGKIAVQQARNAAGGTETVLKSDCALVYERNGSRAHYTKESAVLLSFPEFEGEYYRNDMALHVNGIYNITLPDGSLVLERLDTSVHVFVNRSAYMRKEDLASEYVYVNYKNEDGYKCYMPKTENGVFRCDVSGDYFCEDYTSRQAFTFVSPDGRQESINYINFNASNIHIYKGQRANPIRFEINDRSWLTFFCRESAINYGLILNHCPHCNSLVSNSHDVEACKRQNFKNVRYDYHSQKPKRIYTNAQFKIGVEIEKESYEGACHQAPKIYSRFGWVKERDGSLDSSVGYELVSPCYSLFSSKLYQEAEQIEREFPDLINGEASSACGGPIHFSKKDTRGHNLLEMYCGYLPLLYAIYKSRTKQTYSMAKDKDEMKDSGEKYQAVRVLNDRIEFRIFPAVKNLKSLKWRIDLLRYMAKNPTESPLKVVNDLCDKRTSIHKLFLEIFSEQTIYKRAIDTLIMAKRYDSNYYNIDFSKQTKVINAKAKRQAKK